MKLYNRALCGAIMSTWAVLAYAPAMAASDYLLEIEDYAGPGKPATIEVQSWSWGATNAGATAMGAMTADKRMHKPVTLTSPLATDGQVMVMSPRDSSSGMATGKSACATGKHFTKVTLTARTQSWILSDVTLTDCAADGMTLSYKSVQPAPPAVGGAKIGKSRSNIQNN